MRLSGVILSIPLLLRGGAGFRRGRKQILKHGRSIRRFGQIQRSPSRVLHALLFPNVHPTLQVHQKGLLHKMERRFLHHDIQQIQRQQRQIGLRDEKQKFGKQSRIQNGVR